MVDDMGNEELYANLDQIEQLRKMDSADQWALPNWIADPSPPQPFSVPSHPLVCITPGAGELAALRKPRPLRSHCALKTCNMHAVPDTEVAIIGNGPAGLSLSAFLSGVSPFYNQNSPHPDPVLHEQLSENASESLLEQSLSWAYTWDECGFGSTLRPISALYDTLVRPKADLGYNYPSCLQWEQEASTAVPHLIMAESSVGGSWVDYDKDMLAVSFHSWLDLPGYSIAEWQGEEPPSTARIPAVTYSRYMEAYAERLGMKQRMKSHIRVTSIKKEGDLWRIRGRCPGRFCCFSITARKVVLACGKTTQKMLEVEGEASEKNVVYDIKQLRNKLRQINGSDRHGKRVVIVGDGISSADMVRQCLDKGIAVLHLIKRTDKQLRSITMSRLSPTHYAEYFRVYKLMTGKEHHPLYERRTGAQVISLSKGQAAVRADGRVVQEPFSILGVCIGRRSNMDKVLDKPYTFLDYSAEEDPTLMCVGAFAGDHFVRHLVGGCLEVARRIIGSQKDDSSNANCAEQEVEEVETLEAESSLMMTRSFSSTSSGYSDELPVC